MPPDFSEPDPQQAEAERVVAPRIDEARTAALRGAPLVVTLTMIAAATLAQAIFSTVGASTRDLAIPLLVAALVYGFTLPRWAVRLQRSRGFTIVRPSTRPAALGLAISLAAGFTAGLTVHTPVVAWIMLAIQIAIAIPLSTRALQDYPGWRVHVGGSDGGAERCRDLRGGRDPESTS